MVSRVFSEDVIELDVVDLIGGFGLESLVNEGEFLLVAQKLNIVEDGAEASHGDESGSGAILVLEEGFDQESSESNLFSKSNEDGVEDLLFFVVQTILGVEDGRSVERLKSLGRVLLKILFGENVINLGVEFGVAYESRVVGDHVVVLKCFVLRDSEHDLLDVKNVTEPLARHISLSEDIVILDEFKKSDYESALFIIEQDIPAEQTKKFQYFVNLLLSERGMTDYKNICFNPNDDVDIEGYNPRSLAPYFMVNIADKKVLSKANRALKKTNYYDKLPDKYRKFLNLKDK